MPSKHWIVRPTSVELGPKDVTCLPVMIGIVLVSVFNTDQEPGFQGVGVNNMTEGVKFKKMLNKGSESPGLNQRVRASQQRKSALQEGSENKTA